MISDWAVMRDRDGILLNYYGPSSMTVPLGPDLTVDITQMTDYPVAGTINIAVSPSKATPFTLKLRIPYWSQTTTVELNGQAVQDVRPGKYLAITRQWEKGDRIQLNLDMSLHFWSGEQDCRERTSIYRGPLLLAYDHRYNLHLAAPMKNEAWPEDCGKPSYDRHHLAHMNKPFDRSLLNISTLDARAMRYRPASWPDWLPPLLLLEVTAADGQRVQLCDFGSAGEGGTPYVSWLPVSHAPTPVPFSRDNPLRSQRVSTDTGILGIQNLLLSDVVSVGG